MNKAALRFCMVKNLVEKDAIISLIQLKMKEIKIN